MAYLILAPGILSRIITVLGEKNKERLFLNMIALVI